MTFACGVALVFVQNDLNQHCSCCREFKIEMERKITSVLVCSVRALLSVKIGALIPLRVYLNSTLNLNST